MKLRNGKTMLSILLAIVMVASLFQGLIPVSASQAVNLALGLPEENYTASSHFRNPTGTVETFPKYAFDGQIQIPGTQYTLWAWENRDNGTGSVYPSMDTDPWIQVNFGRAVDFNTVKIYDRGTGARITGVTLEASNDGIQWEPIKDFSFNAADSVKVCAIGESVNYQYLRITDFVGPSPSKSAHILEIEVYNLESTIPVEKLNSTLVRNSMTSAALSWEAFAGAVGYDLYIDGQKFNQERITRTELEVSELTPNQVHVIQIKALNEASDVIAQSEEFKFGSLEAVDNDGTTLPSFSKTPAKIPVTDMALNLDAKGPIISDGEYHFWCASPYVEENGFTHLMICRVPTENFTSDWMKTCEIAYYTGPTPEGPFTFESIVFDNDTPELKNNQLISPHNVRVQKIDDKYVMMFITQHYTEPGNSKSRIQQTSMAIADEMSGPWELVGENGVILSDGVKACNPDIVKVGDEYRIYYKSDKPGGGLTYFLATSDSLTGPYVKQGRVLNNTASFEDGNVFWMNGKLFLMGYDHGGSYTGNYYGILIESKDQRTFDVSNGQIAYGLLTDYLTLPKGSSSGYIGMTRTERPNLVFVNGEPKYLYAAAHKNVDGYPRTQSVMYQIHPVQHSISLAAMENGAVTIDCTTAAQFETVPIQVIPDPGYELVPGSLKVNDTVLHNDSSSFEMGNQDVVITAQFVPEGSMDRAPEIIKQPVSVVVDAGEIAEFSVEAEGYPELSYQWQVDQNDGVGYCDIPGAVDSRLSVENPVACDGYRYQCVISNELGRTVTEHVKLFIRKKSENLALNQKITASSSFDNGTLQLLPEYAVDGNTGTGSRWAPEKGEPGWTSPDKPDQTQWLQIDFGKETSFNQIDLYETEMPRVTKTDVFISNDGTDWALAETISFERPTDIYKTVTLQQTFHTRYVRLSFRTYTQSPNINEIEFYNTTPIPLERVFFEQEKYQVGEIICPKVEPYGASASYCWTVDGIEKGTEPYYSIQPEDEGKTVCLTVIGTGDYSGQISVSTVVDSPKPADKSILRTVLAYAEEQYASEAFNNVIADVQASFTVALEGARAVDADPKAQQAEVDNAWKALMTEIHKLGFVVGDKTNLYQLITVAEGYLAKIDLYTPASAEPFIKALTAAKNVYEDGNAMQDEVADVEDKLLTTMMNLRFKPDKSVLEQILAEAEMIDTAQYTAETVAAFNNARNWALVVYDNEESTQEIIKEATDSLKAAMDGLVPLDSNIPPAVEGDQNVTTGSSNAKTGESTPIATVVSIMVLAAVGLIIRKKTK